MAKFISIDADAHGLLIAVGAPLRDTLSVDRLIAAIDLAQPLTLSNAPLVGERLKQLLKEANVAAAPALVTIGRDRIILKDVRHPPVPPADEPNVVKFAATKDVTDADEMVFDYVPLLGTLNSVEKRAAVAFVKKDIVAAVRTMCDAAGLKVAAITPRPYAAAAALARATARGEAPAPDGAAGIVVVHEGGGEFTIIRDNAVVFTRPISSAAVESEKSLVAELRRNLAVAGTQADVQTLYVAEAETRGEGWSGRLRSALGIPVHPFDPLADLAAAHSIPKELHGRFLGPIGLLAAKGGTLPINFAQPRQPRHNSVRTPNQNRVLVAAALGALAFGVAILAGYLVLDSAEAKVVRLKNELNAMEETIKNAEPDGKRLAAVQEFQGRGVNWLDVYYDESAKWPDFANLKLQQFAGSVKQLPTQKEREADAQKGTPKNAPPKAVGSMTLTVATQNGNLPEDLVRELARDPKMYIGPTKKVGPMVGGQGSKLQQFVIESGLAYRKPEEFVRKLVAAFPKAPPPVMEKVEEKKVEEKKEEPKTEGSDE